MGTTAVDEKSPQPSGNSTEGSGTYLGAEATNKTTARLPSRIDMEALDALLTSECAIWNDGFRAGHAAGVLESDRRVCDSVRNMLADLREGRLL